MSNEIDIKEAFENVASVVPSLYSEDFEKLWKAYDNPNSNKARAFGIYVRKWKDVDIYSLICVIRYWKSKRSKHFCYPYLENFLNTNLEAYVFNYLKK